MFRFNPYPVLLSESHDFFFPDIDNVPKYRSGHRIPLCRRCGKWEPQASPTCPSNKEKSA